MESTLVTWWTIPPLHHNHGRANHEMGPVGAAMTRHRTPVPFVRTAFDETDGRFSPDGRWVAYVSNQSGLNEIYVRAFATDFSTGSAGVGGATLVSRGGGTAPTLASGCARAVLPRTGREDDGRRREGRAGVRGWGTDRALSDPARRNRRRRDGGRQTVLLVTPVGLRASAPFTVVLNWTAELKK